MGVVILGAGPAGLAAAFALAKQGQKPIVLERSHAVGGMCKTIEHNGYLFDIGGHRFFTKFDEVQELWEEILGDQLLLRPRLSRIFYNGKFFDYPLKATNALRNLGLVESTRCMAS
jgi:protoporphyrinogen oxidase